MTACEAHEMVFNFLLVLVTSQRQGQQAQSGWPSLQVAIDLRKHLSCQGQGQCLPEKMVRFRGCEAQSGGLYFEEFAPCTLAREWQRWRAAREEEHMQRSGEMFEEDSHCLMDARFADEMIIVKNEQEGALQVRQVIEQQRQDSFHTWWLKWRLEGRREMRQGIAAKMCLHFLAGGDKVAPEAQQIIVSLIEGDPP